MKKLLNRIYKIPLVKKIARIIRIILQQPKIVLLPSQNGYLLWVDKKSYDYTMPYVIHEHEPFCSKIVRSLLKESNIFVDVGSHIGHFALIASPIVGSEGRVIAIEPDPVAYQILQHNISISNIQNITCFNVAAGAEMALKRLFRSSDGLMNSLFDSNVAVDYVDVSIVTLDNILAKYHVDGLKIDVEGAEAEVLQGAKSLIEQNPNLWMIVELRPNFLRQTVNITPEDFLRLLWNLGFETYYMDEDNHSFELLSPSSYKVKLGNILCFQPGSDAKKIIL